MDRPDTIYPCPLTDRQHHSFLGGQNPLVEKSTPTYNTQPPSRAWALSPHLHGGGNRLRFQPRFFIPVAISGPFLQLFLNLI